MCNVFDCSCRKNVVLTEPSIREDSHVFSLSHDKILRQRTHTRISSESLNKQFPSNATRSVLRTSTSDVDNIPTITNNPVSSSFNNKGFNIGHLNIQGLCGDNLCKFSEISLMLTSTEYKKLHIFGLSETKLKPHKITQTFKISGFQTPFRKDNDTNGGGGIIVYVRDGVNAKRREDLETNGISCLWLEVSPPVGKSFLVGNMYRPPDSKVEYNDRFENFIDMC